MSTRVAFSADRWDQTPVQPPAGHRLLLLERGQSSTEFVGDTEVSLGYRLPGEVSERDGIWAEWQYRNGQVKFANDRYGFYPVYYHASSERFGISTDLGELIRRFSLNVIDDAAVSVFLRLGYYLGDDTPLRDIRSTPPGCTLIWKDGMLSLLSARPQIEPAAVCPSRAHAMQLYGESFQAAIERFDLKKSSQVAVLLSGGRDSRHILLALARCGEVPMFCVTAMHPPPRPNEDAVIAAQLARVVGTPHEIVEPPDDLLKAELEKNVLTNFCADEHGWLMPLRNYLAERSFDCVFDGIGGDVLSAGLFLSETRLRMVERGNFVDLANDLLGKEGYLRSLLPAALYRRWPRELALERVVNEIERHVSSPNPFSQFIFWNRTRREIALSPWCLLSGTSVVFAPYLEKGVYDLLASLPPSYFLDHTFHTKTIQSFYPDFATVPFENKEAEPAKVQRLTLVNLSYRTAAYLLNGGDGLWSKHCVSWLVPRLVRSILIPRYAQYLLPHRAIYLAQLDRTVGGIH